MENTLVESVAKTIRKIRKEKNINQESLAYISGLDRTYISGVERGVRNITLESLETVIKALGMSNSEFLKLLIEEASFEIQDK